MRFRDRRDAGRRLSPIVKELDLDDPVVLALPRGGVPVAIELADALHAQLGVFVARKLGAPGHPELGIGAIAEGGDIVLDQRLVGALGVTGAQLNELIERERAELERRVRRYRGDRGLPEVGGRDVVLVDDGLATGVTAMAALRVLRERGPGRLVLAVPVCARETAERLRPLVDDLVCAESPAQFYAVGAWYDDFRQTDDEEVLDLLGRAATSVAGS
jgi:putative phosphoribosyl transferase